MAAYHLDPDKIITITRQRWVDNFFRPMVVIAMIMCLSLAVVNLVRLVNPAWNGMYFLPGMLLTSVEAVYSHRVMQKVRSIHMSALRFRLVEWGLLVLLLKALNLMGQPWAATVAEIQSLTGSTDLFFSIEFFMLIVLAMAAWGATTTTIADIETLYDPYIDHSETLDSLTGRFFLGGGLLIFISGVTQWTAYAGAASLTDLGQPSLGGVVFTVLAYFTLGLILLSQINLTRLQVRWQMQHIPIGPGLTRRWVQYGVIFLAVVTLVAFVLPTRYTIGLVETLGLAVELVINLILFILQLLILLITLPLAWLMSWLGQGPPAPPASMPPLMPVAPTQVEPGAATPWLEIVRSVLFWGAALAVVGYLLKSYFEDRPELLRQLRQFRWVRWVIDLAKSGWAALRRWLARGLALLPDRLRESQAAAAERWANRDRWSGLNWRQLSPREKIMRYYLNVLEQSARRGVARGQAETPYEFEPKVVQTAPEVDRDMHELTDVFVQARYSQQPFEAAHSDSVKAKWRRIKKSLRGKGAADGGKE
jgi:hypothetical protein